MASALLMPAGGVVVEVGLLTRGPWLAAAAASPAVLSAAAQQRRAKCEKAPRPPAPLGYGRPPSPPASVCPRTSASAAPGRRLCRGQRGSGDATASGPAGAAGLD